MNAGSIYTSRRLQATLAAIRGGWASTREISTRTGSMAVHSDIAGLRDNGLEVETRWSHDANGRRIHEYRLVWDTRASEVMAVLNAIRILKEREAAIPWRGGTTRNRPAGRPWSKGW